MRYTIRHTWMLWIGLLFLLALACMVPARVLYVGHASEMVAQVLTETISARAWLVFDIETGERIAGQYEDIVLPIASLVKLMTAEVMLDTMDLSATATVSYNAVSTEGRAGRLRAGEQLTVRELLFPLLLESSNDAASVIAESVGEDVFHARMNERARALGLTQTFFADPSGLSAGNLSSAYDLQLLLSYLFRERRHALDITLLPSYISMRHDWFNSSPVIVDADYRGGKHGYIPEAERTFMGVFKKSSTGEHLGIILLGSKDISRDVGRIRELARSRTAERVGF